MCYVMVAKMALEWGAGTDWATGREETDGGVSTFGIVVKQYNVDGVALGLGISAKKIIPRKTD